jgi:hypothetical protein
MGQQARNLVFFLPHQGTTLLVISFLLISAPLIAGSKTTVHWNKGSW